jgi:hypothetical protein
MPKIKLVHKDLFSKLREWRNFATRADLPVRSVCISRELGRMATKADNDFGATLSPETGSAPSHRKDKLDLTGASHSDSFGKGGGYR